VAGALFLCGLITMAFGKKRKKIAFCYKDYCQTLTATERAQYQKNIQPLIDIIAASEDDHEIMRRAREYDAIHGTDIFGEAVNLKTYCVACHRVDCIC
jgi:hypothetical protein